jgi:2-oxo-3-hexenedioate decarboxylase/2-keto-4-pentenoate hydratase
MLIADDFFSAGCVLGSPVRAGDASDLAALRGRTLVNGREVGTGRGADVMGHPFRALAWLANHLAGRGTMLRRGEVVLLGSLVQTVWLEPGDAVRMEIEGLGATSLTLSG